MITADKDVRINYREVSDIANITDKNNILFLEKLEKTTKQLSFCAYISSGENLSEYADRVLNPGVFAFFDTVARQPSSPGGFWLCAVPTDRAGAYLKTGILDDFDDFKEAFENGDHPEIYTPIAFTVKIKVNDTETAYTYALSGNKINGLQSFGDLADILKTQNSDQITMTLDSSRITFLTREVGSTVSIGYLESSDAPVDDSGYTITGTEGTWDDFKTAVADLDNLTFKITKADGSDLFAYANVAYKDLTSWEAFAAALNTLSSDTVTVRYSSSGKIVFCTVAVGAAASTGYLTSEQTAGDVNLAVILKGTDASGAVLIQGSAVAATVNAAEKLKGREDSAGVINVPGNDDIHSSSELMSFFYSEAVKKISRPNAVVLSRFINYTAAGSIDIDITGAMITGFNQYFSSSADAVTLCILSLQTNVYANNPFADVQNSANARNIVINFHKFKEEYLDGAVAAAICGIDWEGENVFRNFKGLKFEGITADADIDDAKDDVMNDNRINYYGVMFNGIPMYRNGITCSLGDVSYIDTAAGINALISDLKNKLVKVITEGRLRLNSEGISLIYDALANICGKYVTNGFLAPGSYTVSNQGEMKTSIIDPYRIEISRRFTQQNISDRSFPETKVYIASSRFANTFTINLSDAYFALGS